MVKWWTGLTILTLGLAVTARAQGPSMPGQHAPDVLPEPAPTYDVAPAIAPTEPGPQPDSFNALLGNTPNAWDPPDDHHWPPACYAYLGYMGLQRQRLGNGPVAFFDTSSGGVHTGVVPTTPGPRALDFQDLDPNLLNGVCGTIGYYNGCHAFEVSGFYTGQSTSNQTVAAQGRLDGLFNVGGSFTSFPLGFEGDNGMWLQSDLMRIRLQTAVGSAEANFRSWPGTGGSASTFSWSLGVRYLDIYERLGVFSGDADLTIVGANGLPNPILQANYNVTAHNHIIAPQLGFEWSTPICCWLAFTMTGKGAWGANFLDVEAVLQRGDGLIGLTAQHDRTIFSQLYELGFNLDFRVSDRVKIRAGYDLLWAVDVGAAVDQVSFDLSNPLRTNNHGSIFYAGPMAEFQFLF
jgi:hypothetical protein